MKNMIIILVLAIIVAGCSGNIEEEQNVTDTTNLTDDSIPNNPSQNSPSSEESTDKVNNELTNLMRKQLDMKYHVDYTTTMSTTGAQALEVEMSYYMDGMDRMRIDTLTDDIETRMYMIGNTQVSCSKVLGAWDCMDFSDLINESSSITIDEQKISEVEQSIVTRLPPKTIVGVLSSCFRAEVDSGFVDYCYTPEGIPVYVRLRQDYDGLSEESEMIAKRISTNIPSGTFDIPVLLTSYDSMDINDLVNQY